MRAPLILILAASLALLLQLTLGRGSDAAAPPPPQRHARLVPLPVAAPAARAPAAPAGDRSPFDLTRPGATPQDAASNSFSLIGLIRSGASASAVVRDPAGASHVLRPGDSLQGWRLEGVGRDDVALARGSERRTLTLNGPPEVLSRTPS